MYDFDHAQHGGSRGAVHAHWHHVSGQVRMREEKTKQIGAKKNSHYFVYNLHKKFKPYIKL